MIYDWIVIGAGIAGATLSYELIQKGFSVLLLDKEINQQNVTNKSRHNATKLSYGGLAYWAGSNQLTRQLCEESITYYQNLSTFLDAELDAKIEYRELDLLLTIPTDSNPVEIAQNYQQFYRPPQLLNIQAACQLEPLLNPDAISAALTVKHGHIHPQKTTQALLQAFMNAGGKLETAQVTHIKPQQVITTNQNYTGTNIVVTAGGFTRDLFERSRIPMQIYFTHAEIIQTPPVDLKLHTLIMPASLQRFGLEVQASREDKIWEQSGNQPLPSILDTGAVQFLDGSIRIGQISHTLTDVNADINRDRSEEWLRQSIAEVIPALANLPGTCQRCLVAFSKDSLPVVGNIPGEEGIYVFSGFSNPLVFIPPLASRFSNWVTGSKDEIINQLLPARFITSSH